MSNKLGEVLYERLKEGRSYAHGTSGVQAALDAIYQEQIGAGRRQPGWVPEPAETTSDVATRELERRKRSKEHFAKTPGVAGQIYEALAGGERPEFEERGKLKQRPEEILFRAVDPLGTAAAHVARKKGVSPKSAEALGIATGVATAGAAGAGKALLKKGLGAGAKKLASGAALDMSRGLRELPKESADDLIRAFERESGGRFDLSKLVDEPVTETPVYREGVEGARPSRQIGPVLKPTFDEPITTEELDKLEAALAERAQRLEKGVETTKAVTSKMRERMAGPTPGGALIEGILDQPIGVRVHGDELALEGGGRYNPGNEPTLLLDPREAGDPAGTAAHELGHHVVRKAGEKAPARQISLEAEREAVATIHAKKRDMEYADLAKTFDEGKIDREEYLVRSSKIHNKYSPQLKQTGYQERKTTDEMLDFRVKQDMRKLRAAEEELAAGDPELRSADALLQALQEGQLRQPYRPPGHPTHQQFMSRVDPSLLSIQHGWDEGMADLIESYTLRPEELTENVRALLDEALQGRVK